MGMIYDCFTKETIRHIFRRWIDSPPSIEEQEKLRRVCEEYGLLNEYIISNTFLQAIYLKKYKDLKLEHERLEKQLHLMVLAK